MMLLITLFARVDTTFINSENSKAPASYGLLIDDSAKINLKRSDKYVVLLTLCIYYTWKNIKKLFKNSKFKISNGIEDLSYLIFIICVKYSKLF